MFVKPDNWNELSPLERRKLRLGHWQNQSVEFASPRIGGNMPASLMATGSTKDVRAHCDGLIELFQDTPGYIMTFGCGFERITDEKIIAYRDSVKVASSDRISS